MTNNSEHVTLVICDGMGLSAEQNGNAVLTAPTPTFDYLLNNYPSMRLLAAGTEVGLDLSEPGNSEVGHLAIGTGQVLPQALQIINSSIKSDSYKKNRAFLESLEKVKKANSTLHIVGLISVGGVHGHLDHILALLTLAKEKGVERVAIHAITDGRDSPPQVALQDAQKIETALKGFSFGVIATIGGRFYAMDRDNTWARTDVFYWAMLGRSINMQNSHVTALQTSYGRGETDENMQPTVITGSNGAPVAPLQPNDAVIFTNYRPDRIRQLATRVLMTALPLTVVTMTDYFLGETPTVNPGTTVINAYPLPKPRGTLAETLSRARKSQLHIAETEKYAHITYFFNGHKEQKHPYEDWLLVPSVKIDSFDRTPEMSAKAITAAYVNSRKQHQADFTTINYANMDMVGHTGNFEATCKAVMSVDEELGFVVKEIETAGEWLLITADHGNAEQMINPFSGAIDKEHTTNPVPFLLIHPSLKKGRGMNKYELTAMSLIGMLADIAPTVIEIMGLHRPPEMAGLSLLSQLKNS